MEIEAPFWGEWSKMEIEPPFWGEYGQPLLPEELKRYLTSNIIISRSVDPKGFPLKNIREKDLVGSIDWRLDLDKSLLFNSIEFVIERLSSKTSEYALDFPILAGAQLSPDSSVKELPLLSYSHESIQDKKIPYENLDQIISSETFLTLFEMFPDPVACIDITMTARSWTVDNSEDPFFTTFYKEKTASTLNEALEIAGQRMLRSGGLSTESVQFEKIRKMLSMRFGLDPNGVHTLASTGEEVGLTRERVRQLEKKWLSGDKFLQRKWALPEIFIKLLNAIEKEDVLSSFILKKIVLETCSTTWHEPSQTIDALLKASGHKLPYAMDRKRNFLRLNDITLVENAPKTTIIHKYIRRASGKTGFALKEDVLSALKIDYPDLSFDQLRELVIKYSDDSDLPLGYIFHPGMKSKVAVVQQTQKMLAWAGRCTLSEIRGGLDRYNRWRKYPPPPPLEVLRVFFARRPEFSLNNDVLTSNVRLEREEETLEGKIAMFCEEEPGKVVAKSAIHNYIRQSGKYTSSAGVYITFSPLLINIATGCTALIGSTPTPEEISNAQDLGQNVSIKTEQKWDIVNGSQIVKLLVGTGFRNSGVLSPPTRIISWIGDCQFSIRDDEGNSYGVLKKSNETMLYGLAGVLNAFQIDAGDEIDLKFDKISMQVTVSKPIFDTDDEY